MSCRELGRPDCDGWLLLRKVPSGFMGPRWRRCWFVLKGHTLYWYRQPQVRPYIHRGKQMYHLQVTILVPTPPSTPTCGDRWATDPCEPQCSYLKDKGTLQREMSCYMCKSSLGKCSLYRESFLS